MTFKKEVYFIFVLIYSISQCLNFTQNVSTHCAKSSFFVQKFNFDFPRKLSIFLAENVVVLDFLAVDNFDSLEKLSKKN